MFCPNCGASLQAEQEFCSGCGKPVEPAARQVSVSAAAVPGGSQPPYSRALAYSGTARQGRVACHLRTLAFLWLIVSGLHLVSGMWLFSFGRLGLPFLPFRFPPFVSPILSALGALTLLCAVIGLLVGWALLQHESWGRIFAIVMAILILPRIPFGTALGIYTLWVLIPAQSEAEYRQLARPV